MAISMISTRDPKKKKLSYADVLLAGLAPGGGLYVPAKYPKFSRKELRALSRKKYEDIAFAVKKKLSAGAFPDKELKK